MEYNFLNDYGFFFSLHAIFFFFRIHQSFFPQTPLGIKWDTPYELLGDRPDPRNYCNKFLSFHTRKCLPQEIFEYEVL